MQQTLFVIPHAWLGSPLLWVWAAAGVIVLAAMLSRQGLRGPFANTLGMFVVGLVVIRWLLPQIEILGVDSQNPNGPLVPVGMAIRGYGLFLMLGILAGIALCQWRARQIGIDPDKILSLCFWLVVFGLIGARLFYIIQKWDSYAASKSPSELLSRLADMTEGGLVVYGSLFGGLAAWFVYCRLNKLSLWKVADIMAPAMMIGLALGRIGCLMNGCCFGGPCDIASLGLSFPVGSPAYYRQLETGTLLGITAETIREADGTVVFAVRQVHPGSPAEAHGIQPGDRIERIDLPDDVWLRAIKQSGTVFSSLDRTSIIVQREAAPLIVIPVSQLPDVTRPIWPTQLFSAVNAFLLCSLLWIYYPFRRADGELMALVLILYSVSRYFEELIRIDEPGAFGTNLTIGQWVSVICFVGGVALFIGLRAAARREAVTSERLPAIEA